jgi:hypothetical protein
MRNSKSISRHLCSELVFISRTDRRGRKAGVEQAMLGNLEEIGEWFAEILTDCSFPRAAAVRIVSKTHQLEGVVADCKRHQSLGFFVRVKLAPASRWSDRWFTPQHLLQLWSGTPADQPKVSTLKAASGY